MSLSPTMSGSTIPQLRRIAHVLAPFIALAVLWQIAAFNYIARRTLEILVAWAQSVQVLATVGRILAGLAGAFVLGGVLAVLMARSAAVDRFFAPILNFFQGIPALSWVVFAIIWFHGIE